VADRGDELVVEGGEQGRVGAVLLFLSFENEEVDDERRRRLFCAIDRKSMEKFLMPSPFFFCSSSLSTISLTSAPAP